MLFIFRQLRRLELRKRSGRYFLYAFGEIVLIVVGILIAVQIGDWKEERKNDAAEIEILQNLRADFEKNQEKLQSAILVHERVASGTTKLAKHIGPHANSVERAAFDEMMLCMAFLPEYNPADGVILSIINSEQLSLINNADLKNLITSWPAQIQDYRWSITIVYDYYLNYIYPFLSTHYQMKNLEVGFLEAEIGPSGFEVHQIPILTNPIFENHVEMRRINAQRLLGKAKSISDYQRELLDMLDQELN